MLNSPKNNRIKAFLGITSSCTNRLWLGLTPEQDNRSHQLKQLCNVDDIIARSLSRMNIPPEEVESYLNPQLKNLMFDPSLLLDLDKAAHRIFRGIIANETIAVISNGRLGSICATGCLVKWFSHYSRGVSHLAIEKEIAGYFPAKESFVELAKSNDIVLCLGCGSNLEIDTEWVRGTDVIVVDDHVSMEKLPKIFAMINSNRFDEHNDFSYLGTTGLFFLLMVATNRLFRNNNRKTINLYPFLDLVALGTVSDFLPMIKLNRALVKNGLASINTRENLPLRFLLDTLALRKPLTSSQLAFQIGARITAGEVIQNSQLGLDLLTTTNKGAATKIANQLDDLYRTSSELTEEYIEKFNVIIRQHKSDLPLVWGVLDACPLGILEKVVSNINQNTNKPTILMTKLGNKLIAVGQSVPGINLGTIVANCLGDRIISTGGGNPMRIMVELLPEGTNRFIDRVTNELYLQRMSWEDSFPLYIDGLLSPQGVNYAVIKKLSQLEPFGINSPKPRYCFANQVITSRVNLGDGQFKLVIKDGKGYKIEGFLPKSKPPRLEKFLLKSRNKRIHLAGTLTSLVRNGKTLPTVLVEDAAVPN